jgi:hypothetical protein
MVNFLATIGLVCVLPFVVVMIEHEVKQLAHARRVMDRAAGGGRRTATALERAQQGRAWQFTPMIYPATTLGPCSYRFLRSPPSEGSSLYGEVAFPQIWLPSISCGRVSGRSDALESFFQQRKCRIQRRRWNCPI